MKINYLEISGVVYDMTTETDLNWIYTELVNHWGIDPNRATKIVELLRCGYKMDKWYGRVHFSVYSVNHWYCALYDSVVGPICYETKEMRDKCCEGYTQCRYWEEDIEEDDPPYPVGIGR